MSAVQELLRAQVAVWVTAVTFSVIAVAWFVGAGGWLSSMGGNFQVFLMAVFCFLQAVVHGAAAGSMAFQALALRALNEDPDTPGGIERLLAARRWFWRALTVAAVGLIGMVCVVFPLNISEFWR